MVSRESSLGGRVAFRAVLLSFVAIFMSSSRGAATPKVPKLPELKARVGELFATNALAPKDRQAAFLKLFPPAVGECAQEDGVQEDFDGDIVGGPGVTVLSWNIVKITYDPSYLGHEPREACPGRVYGIESMAHVVVSELGNEGEAQPERVDLDQWWVMVDGIWYADHTDE